MSEESRRRMHQWAQDRQDEILRATIGEEKFKAFERKRRLDRVCCKCPWATVDWEGGRIEDCNRPNDYQCMRAHEEDLIRAEEENGDLQQQEGS